MKRRLGDLRTAAAEIIRAVELEQIVLHSARLRTVTRDVAPPYETETMLQVKAEPVEGGVESWSSYTVTAEHGDAGDEPVWQIKLDCYARFAANGPLPEFSEEQLSAFAIVHGAYELHPFAREYVQSLTSKSAFPAYTLGILTPIAELDDDVVLEIDGEDD